MAGEGLIWAGIGQGIANAGSTMGQFLMRSQERESEREYRDKLEQERREYRDKTDQEKREYRAEQDALYKRTAAQQMEGRAAAAKDQGVQIEDLAPGGRAANMAANTLGYSEDDYNKFYRANKTGDLSEFARPIGKTLDDTYGEQVVTEIPSGLREEFALKRKELGKLQEVYALKKDYKEVMQGRQAGFEIDVGQGVLGGTIPLDKGAGAVAASQGKPLYDVKDGTQFNQYTGKNEATAVGGSTITENLAQAGEATAKGTKATAEAGLVNFKTNVGQGVISGATKMGIGSGAVAAAEGKPIINIEGGEQYNQYSGEGKTTALGKSQIAENQAKAGEAKQKGDAAETKAERQEKEKRETTKDLERRIENNLAVLHEKLGVNKNEANAALDSLRKRAAKDPAAAARLKELQPFIDKVDASRAKLDAWEAKAAAPAPAPAPAVKALPSGAVLVGKSGGKNVYQLPDGTRYIQK